MEGQMDIDRLVFLPRAVLYEFHNYTSFVSSNDLGCCNPSACWGSVKWRYKPVFFIVSWYDCKTMLGLQHTTVSFNATMLQCFYLLCYHSMPRLLDRREMSAFQSCQINTINMVVHKVLSGNLIWKILQFVFRLRSFAPSVLDNAQNHWKQPSLDHV